MATAQTMRTHKRKTSRAGIKAQSKSTKKRGRKGLAANENSTARNAQIHSTYTGTRLFDRSLHKTNTLLKELMENMNWQNREKALTAFRATLHSLRDILPIQEIPQFASQLPIMVRGLYYENWKLMQQPLRIKSVNEFYELVRLKLGRASLNFSTEDLKRFTRATIQLLSKRVSKGEMKDVKNALRKNLKGLFEESSSSRSIHAQTRSIKRTRRSRSSKTGRPAQIH